MEGLLCVVESLPYTKEENGSADLQSRIKGYCTFSNTIMGIEKYLGAVSIVPLI